MEYADYEDLKMEHWLRMRDSGELVWKTKGGQEIPVKDMTDSHLENAIARCEYMDEMMDRYCYDPNEDAGDRI